MEKRGTRNLSSLRRGGKKNEKKGLGLRGKRVGTQHREIWGWSSLGAPKKKRGDANFLSSKKGQSTFTKRRGMVALCPDLVKLSGSLRGKGGPEPRGGGGSRGEADFSGKGLSKTTTLLERKNRKSLFNDEVAQSRKLRRKRAHLSSAGKKTNVASVKFRGKKKK